MVGGAWFDARTLHTQSVHILVIGIRIALCNHLDIDMLFGRRLIDLVVDIGDVSGVDHIGVVARQYLPEEIEDHCRACIPDMGIVVDRRAAGIHRHTLRVERFEGLFATGQGVVDMNAHRSCLAERDGGCRSATMCDSASLTHHGESYVRSPSAAVSTPSRDAPEPGRSGSE